MKEGCTQALAKEADKRWEAYKAERVEEQLEAAILADDVETLRRLAARTYDSWCTSSGVCACAFCKAKRILKDKGLL